ncbi:hypothetical protein ACO0RG_002522 [Hanseniaspora osmophila]
MNNINNNQNNLDFTYDQQLQQQQLQMKMQMQYGNDYENNAINTPKRNQQDGNVVDIATGVSNNNNDYLMPPLPLQQEQTIQQPQQPQQPQQSQQAHHAHHHQAQNTHHLDHPVTPKPRKQPKEFHRTSLGDWEFIENIGSGSMGKVKVAKHKYTNEVCAVKIVTRAVKTFLYKHDQYQAYKNKDTKKQFDEKLKKEASRDKRTVREASLGQILYHPHICRLFEMCTMTTHFYMLFEYVKGGQLLDYIIQHGSLKEKHARKFARGIASALQYLHMNNIVHRDLKIENIMISKTGEIKLIDFGLSNFYNYSSKLHTFCGSLYFAAPELLMAKPYTGPEVDVWSFGVVLYVLVCGKVPFDDENASVLHAKIKEGKVEYPNHLSIDSIALLSRMLVVDPLKRASLQQVICHQWMNKNYDFITPSYLPYREPIQRIDKTVVKEMCRLELYEDVEQTYYELLALIGSPEYTEMAKEYYNFNPPLISGSAKNNDVHNNYTYAPNNFDTASSDVSMKGDSPFGNGNLTESAYASASASSMNSLNSSAFPSQHQLHNKDKTPLVNTNASLVPKTGSSVSLETTSKLGTVEIDPTRAFHPMISTYYLVFEMMERKKLKLRKRNEQALKLQQQQQ